MNKKKTCNCRRLSDSCFFQETFGNRCKCDCHKNNSQEKQALKDREFIKILLLESQKAAQEFYLKSQGPKTEQEFLIIYENKLKMDKWQLEIQIEALKRTPANITNVAANNPEISRLVGILERVESELMVLGEKRSTNKNKKVGA